MSFMKNVVKLGTANKINRALLCVPSLALANISKQSHSWFGFFNFKNTAQ